MEETRTPVFSPGEMAFHHEYGWGEVIETTNIGVRVSLATPGGSIKCILDPGSISPFGYNPDGSDRLLVRSWDAWAASNNSGGTLLETLEKELDRECDELLKEMEAALDKDPGIIDRLSGKIERLESAAALSDPEPKLATPKHRYDVGDIVQWVLGPGSPLGEIVELTFSGFGSYPSYNVKMSNGETKGILEFSLRPWDTKSAGSVFPDAPATISPLTNPGNHTAGMPNSPRTYPLVPGDAFPKREQPIDTIREPEVKTDIYAMPPFSPNIRKLAALIHDMAKAKGFWDSERNVGEMLMLVTSELAEAIEAHRKERYADLKSYRNQASIADQNTAFLYHVKDTFEDEIADAVIRLLDLCAGLGIDIEEHVFLKLQYNAGRPRLHGKKY